MKIAGRSIMARREKRIPEWVLRSDRRAALWAASEALVGAYLPRRDVDGAPLDPPSRGRDDVRGGR